MSKFYATLQGDTLLSLYGIADFPQGIAAIVLEWISFI